MYVPKYRFGHPVTPALEPPAMYFDDVEQARQFVCEQMQGAPRREVDKVTADAFTLWHNPEGVC